MAGRLDERDRRRWMELGVEALRPDEGIRQMHELLPTAPAQVAVFAMDWVRFIHRFRSGSEPALLSELAREARLVADDADCAAVARERLLERLELARPEERLEILAAFVAAQVSEVLGAESAEAVDPSRGFFEVGMDSLMAVDLQRRLQSGLGIVLPATVGFDHPTIDALAKHIAEKALGLATDPEGTAPDEGGAAEEERSHDTSMLAQMSEDELIALVAQELEESDDAESR